MKVFVTGVCGQLGYDTVNELNKRGFTVVGSDILSESACACEYIQLDITDKDAVEKVLTECKPDAVIHCAAWTAVDAAEDEENQEKVRKVNAVGTENIALACKALDTKMMYISTDYVFNGQGEEPWDPDCKDYEPLSVYGQTKLEGELAVADNVDKHFIVRIAWVFGKNGNNFIKTMLRLGLERDELNIINDQVGSPTYTADLAPLLVDMMETDKYGIYHATNEGFCSWYEFTNEIFKQSGIKVKTNPITTDQYPTKAKRPMNSRMSKNKLEQSGFGLLPIWKKALSKYLIE